MKTLLACIGLLASSAAAAADHPRWQPWKPQVFAQARAEHRYVLLDLGAGWCHWCHVMDAQTYADAGVISQLGERYLAIRADADATPELATRYGDWGWPATIVFSPDGDELVKRRGFIPPEQMRALLQAVVEDPTPGPSVRAEPANAGDGGALAADTRAALAATVDEVWDESNAGWGRGQKFLDAQTLEWMFARAADGDTKAEAQARRTLTANLALIDRVDGGVFQYSDEPDWSSPHYEKIMSYQADDLRLYAEAWRRWRDPAYREAARAIDRYLRGTLLAPDGSFYASQDADRSAVIGGRDYYSLDAAHRRALGAPPLDRHRYARENGWAIRALAEWSMASGDASALDAALRAARWAMRARAVPGGAFRHEAKPADVTHLADNLAMAEAFEALSRATGKAAWRAHAAATADYIERTFRDEAGYAAESAAYDAGVFAKRVRNLDDNLALGRIAARLAAATGEARFTAMARHAERYYAAASVRESGRFLPGLLLADAQRPPGPDTPRPRGP